MLEGSRRGRSGRRRVVRRASSNVPRVNRLKEWLRPRYVRYMLEANYHWGPRFATALRKRWIIFKNPQADIRFNGSAYLGARLQPLRARPGGASSSGAGTEFRKGFRVEIAHGGSVEIGDRCVFSYYSVIQCSTSIKIGDRAMFGQASIIVDGNHRLQDISTDIFAQPYDYRDDRHRQRRDDADEVHDPQQHRRRSPSSRRTPSSTSRFPRTASTAACRRGSSTTSDRPSWNRRSGPSGGRGRASPTPSRGRTRSR